MNFGFMSADVCLLNPQNVIDIASKPNENENTATMRNMKKEIVRILWQHGKARFEM